MQKYADVVLDRKGNAVPNALVLVKELGSTTPATIYSANAALQQANPIAVDSLGRFSFYAVNGQQPEERDEEGNIVQAYMPAGNRYGIRYDEAHSLEAACERWQRQKVEARLTDLEEKMAVILAGMN